MLYNRVNNDTNSHTCELNIIQHEVMVAVSSLLRWAFVVSMVCIYKMYGNVLEMYRNFILLKRLTPLLYRLL